MHILAKKKRKIWTEKKCAKKKQEIRKIWTYFLDKNGPIRTTTERRFSELVILAVKENGAHYRSMDIVRKSMYPPHHCCALAVFQDSRPMADSSSREWKFCKCIKTSSLGKFNQYVHVYRIWRCTTQPTLYSKPPTVYHPGGNIYKIPNDRPNYHRGGIVYHTPEF